MDREVTFVTRYDDGDWVVELGCGHQVVVDGAESPPPSGHDIHCPECSKGGTDG
jgi:hypothetical protein